MIRRLLPLALVTALASSGCSAPPPPPDPTCAADADRLRTALASASAGDVVSLCGSIRGSFEVPAGVGIEGFGNTLTAEEGAALIVTTGQGTTQRIRNVSLVVPPGEAAAALIAHGSGALALDDLQADVAAGYGIVGQGLASLSLTDVSVRGAATDEVLAELGNPDVWHEDVLTAGVMVSGGEGSHEVALSGVEVVGFAGVGVALLDVTADLSGVSVRDGFGIGVLLDGVLADLTRVTVRSLKGAPVLDDDAVIGVAMVHGTRASTVELVVGANEGTGVLQHASWSTNLRAWVGGNEARGWVVQATPDTTTDQPALVLETSTLLRNRGAGVALLGVGGARLHDAVIAETRAVDDSGSLVADGLVAAAYETPEGVDDTATDVLLDGVVLYGNGRAAIMLDGDRRLAVQSPTRASYVCSAELDSTRWTCTEEDEHERRCVRTVGPDVGPSWTGADDASGTVVQTNESSLVTAEAVPRLPAPATSLTGDVSSIPETCASAVGALVVDAALPTDPITIGGQPGSVGGMGTLGSEWFACTREGSARVCRHTPRASLALQAADNPTVIDAPGWTCEATAEGRVCHQAGFGVARQAGASPVPPSVQVDDLALASRDALLDDGTLPVVGVQRAGVIAPSLRDVGLGAELVGGGGVISREGVPRDFGLADWRGIIAP